MLKFKVDYQAVITQEYDQRFRENEIRYLQRKAAKFGLTLLSRPQLLLFSLFLSNPT